MHNTRRHFLQSSATTLSLLSLAQVEKPWALANAGILERHQGKEFRADIAIIGGGLGGISAALAALEAGQTVILTEETDWIGGQITSQAVPPDENPWIETHGANRSWQAFRQGVRDYYKANYPLTPDALKNTLLNPGNGSVSRLCCEPRVALSVFTNMLARYVSSGQLLVLTWHKPHRAETGNDRIESVTIQDQLSQELRVIQATTFIDATELGDLAELAQAEHVVGFESQADTGEALAPSKAQPENQQAFTICFALEHDPAQEHLIEKPAEYAFWRDYLPNLKPAWPGKLLSLTYSNPITLEPRTLGFDPTRPNEAGWWKYRRIIDSANFKQGTYPKSGITLVNWPQNDYLLGNLIGPGVTSASVTSHIRRSKQLSLSLVYWLQTEAPRPDGGQGWPGLKLRGDLLGTADGLAKYPYIRESRRLKTKFTVTTTHVGAEERRKAIGNQAEVLKAEQFTDSVGIGAYRIDLHPTTGGDNYIDISSLPFQIPLGSLIPIRIKNLIPACKNLGVTHLTNGCYRLHPVEWAIGEAAGSLAAFSIKSSSEIQKVYDSQNQRADYLKMLDSLGVRRVWKETKPL